jgi:hypothetical protein
MIDVAPIQLTDPRGLQTVGLPNRSVRVAFRDQSGQGVASLALPGVFGRRVYCGQLP